MGQIQKWNPYLVVAARVEVITQTEVAPAGTVVKVHRSCARHLGKTYESLYALGVDGRFHYVGSKRLSNYMSQLQLYNEEDYNTVPIPSYDIGEEDCPWCGEIGYGAIFCPPCNFFCCYGKVNGDTYECAYSHRGPLVQRRMNYIGRR